MSYVGTFDRKLISDLEAYKKGWIRATNSPSTNSIINRKSYNAGDGTVLTIYRRGCEGATGLYECPSGYYYVNLLHESDLKGENRGFYGYSGNQTYKIALGAKRSAIYLKLNHTNSIITNPAKSFFGGFDHNTAPMSPVIRYIDNDGNIFEKDMYVINADESNLVQRYMYYEGVTDTLTIYKLSSPGTVNDTTKYQPNNVNPAGTDLVTSEFTNYKLGFSANINIFTDIDKCDNFLRNGIIEEDSENEDLPYEGPNSPIGDNYSLTDFNSNIDNSAPLSRALLLTKNNMNKIAEALYSDSSGFQSILEGLDLYGQQPLSFIVDSFYLPFDPTPFITIESTPVTTNFGKTEVAIGEHKVIGSCAKIVTVAETSIVGAYNDFRDYLGSNYYIYLPYCGIMLLEIEKYMYHKLKVKVFFDVRTGSLKYYLCSDDKVQDMYECSVRESMPLISTDTYQATREKISSAFNLAGGIATSIMNPVAGAALLGQMADSALNIEKTPPAHLSGSFSPASTICDSLDIVIWIQQKEISYPNNMRETYGIPDNKISTIGSFSGFIKCDDIILESSQSQNRKDKVVQLLSEGIFV